MKTWCVLLVGDPGLRVPWARVLRGWLPPLPPAAAAAACASFSGSPPHCSRQLPQGELRTVVDRLVRVVYDQGLQIQALQRTAQEAARADDVAQLRDSSVSPAPSVL